MVSVKAIYQGEKHCEIIHGPSGAQISTDAPKDNNGKGELFSPTDLVGAAVASCILTVVAIAADRDGVDIKGSTCTVDKEMITNPRRIGKFTIRAIFPASVPADYRHKLEVIAQSCPVKKSLHPDTVIDLKFDYLL